MRLWRHISEKVKYRKSARPIPSKGPQLAFPALVDHPDHSGMSLYTSIRGHFEQYLMHEKPISVDAKLFLTKSPQKHRELLWEPQLASKRHGARFFMHRRPFRTNLGQIKNLVIYLVSLSLILETFHLFIPERSFQLSDLFGNFLGVIVVIFVRKLINKYGVSKK